MLALIVIPTYPFGTGYSIRAPMYKSTSSTLAYNYLIKMSKNLLGYAFSNEKIHYYSYKLLNKIKMYIYLFS
jgi:hypothetical protein